MGAKCCALIGRGDSGADDGKLSAKEQAALRGSVRGSMYDSPQAMELADARNWNGAQGHGPQYGNQWGAPPGSGFPGSGQRQQPGGIGGAPTGDFGLGGTQQHAVHGSLMQQGGWGGPHALNHGQAYGSGAMPQAPGSAYYVNQRGPPLAPLQGQGGHQQSAPQMSAASPPGVGAPAISKPANRATHYDAAGADEYGVVRVGAKKTPEAALPAVAEHTATPPGAPGFNGPATTLKVRNIAGDVVLSCTALQTANQNVAGLKRKIGRSDGGDDTHLEFLAQSRTLKDDEVLAKLMSINSGPVMEVQLVHVVAEYVVPHPARRAHRRKAGAAAAA